MGKKIFEISISEAESIELEKSWYNLQGDQATIAFCMAQPSVNWEAVEKYREIMIKENYNCESLKQQLAHKYKPEEVELNKYNFSFDFIELIYIDIRFEFIYGI